MADASRATASTSATPPRSRRWSRRFSATGPLTGLVNNAAGNFISRTEDLSPRGFDAIANIVMHGTFYVTQAVGKRWIAAKQKGSVVSIAVTWVRNGGPFVVPSAMSKAAIQAMTMSLAQEWGRYGIRLNAIAPGEIPTEGMSKRLMPGAEPGASAARNPMGRVGRMEELQNLATFLMSDGCEWLSGETIVMDGAEALATGGNFYELRRWGDTRMESGARGDPGVERARQGGARLTLAIKPKRLHSCGRTQLRRRSLGKILVIGAAGLIGAKSRQGAGRKRVHPRVAQFRRTGRHLGSEIARRAVRTCRRGGRNHLHRRRGALQAVGSADRRGLDILPRQQIVGPGQRRPLRG